jgi:hypothetical protein
MTAGLCRAVLHSYRCSYDYMIMDYYVYMFSVRYDGYTYIPLIVTLPFIAETRESNRDSFGRYRRSGFFYHYFIMEYPYQTWTVLPGLLSLTLVHVTFTVVWDSTDIIC